MAIIFAAAAAAAIASQNAARRRREEDDRRRRQRALDEQERLRRERELAARVQATTANSATNQTRPSLAAQPEPKPKETQLATHIGQDMRAVRGKDSK